MTLQKGIPETAKYLADAKTVASRIYQAIHNGSPLCLLRYGDTGGRILSRAPKSAETWHYLTQFLGNAVTEEQIEWLAGKIEESALQSDIVGLRSDLLGPQLPDQMLSLQGAEVLENLRRLYPIRAIEQNSLSPDDARRLFETRAAMERFRFSAEALFTHAWIHVDLLEIGFISALFRHAPAVSLITSSTRKDLVSELAKWMNGRLRYFACPAYPAEERLQGGDDRYLWQKWESLLHSITPKFPGEPLLISAGIWTKPLAAAWRNRGGVAIDFGSALDYLDAAATRPAVLGDRYGTPNHVPHGLTLGAQFQRNESLVSFA